MMRIGRLLTLPCSVAVLLLAGPSAAFALIPDYVRIVGNQSSRDGARPELIVLHTTYDPRSGPPVVHNEPGLGDLERLGAWFDRPSTEVSSHVADDAEGNDARYVPDRREAWTVAAFNPVSLNIEQIGSAGLRRREWIETREPQLKTTARWIALWHLRWRIPIRRAEVAGSVVLRSGVATHDRLGTIGGGHHDPGPGYPVGYVLKLARAMSRAQSHGA
jgi:N-acetylmuramoyl-L-alanine amidase